MARFEVFIPAADESGFNVTFRVDAANWMAALKTGLQKLGEQGNTTKNVLVDIQDDESVHVTDPASGRVFHIRELAPPAASPQANTIAARDEGTDEWEPPQPEQKPEPKPEPVAAAEPEQTANAAPTLTELPSPPPREAVTIIEPRREPSPGPVPVPVEAERDDLKKTIVEPRAPGRVEPEAVVELKAPTRPITGKIGREPQRNRKEQIEDLLAEVFERVQEVYAQRDRQAALYYLLDLALEKIPAEAGTVFGADASTGDLTFEAVRGPKAKELQTAKLTIPAGSGVAGFCALEGVAIALSDIQKDPRYYSVVAQRVNYTPKSVLCAPLMSGDGRTFGCLQILNRQDGPQFTEVEMGLATYIAKQGAAYLESL